MIEVEHLPTLTLHQPWASWILWGWKTIETRTHHNFRRLSGRRIFIHSSQRIDHDAFDTARPYLHAEQLEWLEIEGATGEKLYPKGMLLASANVVRAGWLGEEHEAEALIPCRNPKRFGLFLRDVRVGPLIQCPGKQGIWYPKEKPGREATKPDDHELF